LVNILKTSPDDDLRSGTISAYVDQPDSHQNAETKQLMMNVLKNELGPEHIKAGNQASLSTVMSYSSGLKRDGAIEQVMFSNLSRNDLDGNVLAYTLRFYSLNQPLSKDEKAAIKSLILKSRDSNIQSWGRSLNLR